MTARPLWWFLHTESQNDTQYYEIVVDTHLPPWYKHCIIERLLCFVYLNLMYCRP